MSKQFERMERCAKLACQQDAPSLRELIDLLADPDWMVQLAAAVALGDRRDPRAKDSLLRLLRTEDAAPLYTQDKDIVSSPAGSNSAPAPEFPEGTTAATRSAWERRGRLKQAACFALADIGGADPLTLEFLHRYATDAKEDYSVRAAASRALGTLRDPSSKPFLATAAKDEEWCTKTEAEKALKLFQEK